MPAPPARRAEQLMSEESNDAEESGELSGEVHSILSSRDDVRQGVCSGNGQDGVMVRRRYDDQMELQAGGGPGNGARGRVEPRALVQLVGTTVRQEGIGCHHVLRGLALEKSEASRRTQHQNAPT